MGSVPCSSGRLSTMAGAGDFPSCMETVKAKELRCVDTQVTTTDGKPVGHVEGQEQGIGAPCYWMAPVEAEKVCCSHTLHSSLG